MTPREVEELSGAEFKAMVDYANRQLRAQARRARRR